jgi:hypothetical protein
MADTAASATALAGPRASEGHVTVEAFDECLGLAQASRDTEPPIPLSAGHVTQPDQDPSCATMHTPSYLDTLDRPSNSGPVAAPSSGSAHTGVENAPFPARVARSGIDPGDSPPTCSQPDPVLETYQQRPAVIMSITDGTDGDGTCMSLLPGGEGQNNCGQGECSPSVETSGHPQPLGGPSGTGVTTERCDAPVPEPRAEAGSTFPESAQGSAQSSGHGRVSGEGSSEYSPSGSSWSSGSACLEESPAREASGEITGDRLEPEVGSLPCDRDPVVLSCDHGRQSLPSQGAELYPEDSRGFHSGRSLEWREGFQSHGSLKGGPPHVETSDGASDLALPEAASSAFGQGASSAASSASGAQSPDRWQEDAQGLEGSPVEGLLDTHNDSSGE